MNTGDIIDKHFKLIAVILGAVVVGCVAIMVSIAMGRNAVNGAYVSITVAPTTATVTLSGTEYHVGTHKMEPGKYDVKVEAEGFKPKEFSIDVKDGKTTSISTYLLHKVDGLGYYEKNAAEMEALKYIDHSEPGELKSFLEGYQKKMDIIYILPLRVVSIPTQAVISDGSTHDDCDRAFCLLVTGSSIDEAKIRAAISDKGFEPSDYKIIYDKEDE